VQYRLGSMRMAVHRNSGVWVWHPIFLTLFSNWHTCCVLAGC